VREELASYAKQVEDLRSPARVRVFTVMAERGTANIVRVCRRPAAQFL